MKKSKVPFEFNQCMSLIKATGKKARSLRDLRRLISKISDESIFHHTCQYFQKGHILEYTNDFAHWAGESLEERALSERLSNIDTYTFKSVGEVRKEVLNVVDDYLRNFPEPRPAHMGDEFHFNETVSFIFSVGIKVRNVAEFLLALRHIDPGCIYFHFFEARVRLGNGVDDFSRWFEYALDKDNIAARIRKIDPFMHDIENIREHLIEAIEEDVREEMEAGGI